MSLIPNFEDKKIHILDNAIEEKFKFNIINNPLHPSHCPAIFLPFVAKEYDIDISLFSEEEAREILSSAIWSKTKVGTLAAVKNAINTFDEDAVLLDFKNVPRRDGTISRDGTIKYTNFGIDHWAKYSVRLSRPMSLSQKSRLILLLSAIAPARCELISIDAQSTIIHDGVIKRNSNYTYGGYING